VHDADYQCLTPNIRIARSPRFSPPKGDKSCHLVFLSTAQKPFDTHLGCFGLDSIDWIAGEPVIDSYRTVVGQVSDPNDTANHGVGTVAGLCFPGLFLVELSHDCFVSATTLVTTTQWGSCQKVVQICLYDCTVKMVSCTGGEEQGAKRCCVQFPTAQFSTGQKSSRS
jgi:hypothetical protein